MNWGRGLLRLWIAFTVLWLVGWSIFVYTEWPEPAEVVAAADDGFVRKPDGSVDWTETLLRGKVEQKAPVQDPHAVRKHLTIAAQVVAVPPAILFVLGWGCLWIARGFKRA